MSDIDSVSLYNGRVNVHIPLFNIAGRGAPMGQARFTMDSPTVWRVQESPDGNGNPYYSAEPADSSNNTGGIRLGQPFVFFSESVGGATNPCVDGINYTWQFTLTRGTLVDGNGTEHPMRDVISDGQALPNSGSCSGIGGPSRGRVFKTTDGSEITYIADADIRDGILGGNEQPQGGGNGGLILFPDGRRYSFANGATQALDRNGNKTVFTGDTSALDSLQRQTTLNYPSEAQCAGMGLAFPCLKIVRKGFGGTDRTVKFGQAWLGGTLGYRPGQIVLPNGQKYQFYCDSYGDLTRIDLPSGGSIEYTYGPGIEGLEQTTWPIVQGAIPGTYGTIIYRRVTERRLYREGHVLENRQTFSKPEVYNQASPGYVEKKVYDAGSNLVNSEKHYFYGLASSSLSQGGLAYTSWKEGREYRTEVYNQNGTLLRRVDQTWEQRAPIGWWTDNPDAAPTNDPRLKETITQLENGLTSKVSYTYDPTVPYNSLTDVREYAFGNNAPGPLLRQTQTTYLKTLNGVDYTGVNIAATLNTAAPYLRGLPLQASVYDAAGTEQSRTVFEYDNYAAIANHGVLADCANISGHDVAFGLTYTTRGNVTAVTRYTDAQLQTGAVTAYSQYDIAGNIVKAIDAKAVATTIEYADRFGAPKDETHLDDSEARSNTAPAQLGGQQTYAFATKITNALGHTAYTQFDYFTGQAVNGEDANGTVSSAYYDDSLDRPTKSIVAANVASLRRQSRIVYDDAGRIVTNFGDLNVFGDEKLRSESRYDGLGRTTEGRNYESDTQYYATRTKYDALGRVVEATNPFRNATNPTLEKTYTAYDALSRVTGVTAPDGAQVQTFYDGNRVLVKDPAGKQRMSQTDALGRLTDVWEITPPDQWTEDVSFPGQAAMKAYRTSYGYDILGNLLQVNQGGQTRYFLYDSLSRLRAAKNPEQGALTRDGDFTNLPAGAAGWSMAYLYDANGNLTKRRDARNVETTYTYDALNRNLTTIYSDGTPTVTRRYDGVANGLGALWQTETANTALVTVDGFDKLGRPSRLQQQFRWNNAWSAPYTVTRSYGLTQMTAQTYPSGHTTTYAYDPIGRLNNFGGNLGDGVTRAYADEPHYNQRGQMDGERYGMVTPLYHRMSYNQRGQMADMQLGAGALNTPDAYNRGRIQNYYASTTSNNVTTLLTEGANNNGNLLGQDNSIPNYTGGTGPTNFRQVYDYDSLNRLKGASEYYNGGATAAWRQQFDYDRWGNRTINQTATTNGIPKPDFTCDTSNNHLLPGPTMAGLAMIYDAAGNLTTDTATGAGGRTFDAENRMISAQATLNGGNFQQFYTYDGDGRRIARGPYNSGVWQIYGFEGELLAEYGSGALKILPQKEYGYVGGKLLITASNGDDYRLKRFVENIYLRTWGTVPADTYKQAGINALVAALGNNGQADTGAMLTEAKRQVALAFDHPSYRGDQRTNEQYVADLYLAYLQRAPEPGAIAWYAGFLNNNQLTRLQLRNEFANGPEFAGIVNALYGNQSGDYDRVDRLINQIYTAATGNLPSGGQYTFERNRFDTAEAKGLNDVKEAGKELGRYLLGANAHNYNGDWLPSFRTDLTTTEYVTRLYQTFLRRAPDNGLSGYVTQADANPNGRNTVLEAFLAMSAYSERSGALYREIFWLISDHLGTPRLIAERTGKLEGIKRSDYLPFGESANALGGRATTQGYAGESVRQGFTGYEEDAETGLDYAQARYMSSAQGRFVSVDPLMASATVTNPKTWNRYAYALNNPLRIIDPSGLRGEPVSSETTYGIDDPQDPPKPPPTPCKPEVLTLGNGEQKSVREAGCGNGSLITADVTIVAGAAAIAVPAASEAITGITLTTSASAIAEIVGGVSLGTSVAGVAGIAAGVVICAGLLNAIDNPRPATASGPGGVGISCTAGPQAFPQPIPRVPPILGDGVRCFYRGQNENYCTYQCYIGTTPVQKLHTWKGYFPNFSCPNELP